MTPEQRKANSWEGTADEAYLFLAKLAIPFAPTAEDLREWWDAEKDSREAAELSPEQVQELIDLCAAHVATVPKGERREERRKPPRRVAAI